MTKFDLRKVEYSWNDIKQGIKVPEHLTEELAYFLGFHVGDGYMKIIRRSKTVDYRLVYDGHQINEFLYYQDCLKPLIRKLFNKEVNVVKTTRGTVNISFYSKAILTFLHQCCGLEFSPKKNVDIPGLIKRSSSITKANFLRGLADTDFSLVFKERGRSPVIDHATCSQKLHDSIKKILAEFGFSFSSGTYDRERKGTKIIRHQININGKKNLQKWMETIGYSSYNTLTRYAVWKETGSLLPKTGINDRIKILKERGIEFPPPVTP